MLRTRILIGLALIGGVMGLMVVDDHIASTSIGLPIVTPIVLLALVWMAERELLVMLRGRRCPAVGVVQAVFLAVTVASWWLSHQAIEAGDTPGFMPRIHRTPWVAIMIFCWGMMALLAQATWRYQRRPDEGAGIMADAQAGLMTLIYVALPMTLLLGIVLGGEGGGVRDAVCLVLISKAGDIGGYLVGTLIGRRRMMPNVSPKKSWEGSAAGLVLSIAVTLVIIELLGDRSGGVLSHLTVPTGVLLAVVTNLATQAGDFCESMIKRSVGTKDSAHILPTFGGVLDVLDSLVFAIPAAWTVIILTA